MDKDIKKIQLDLDDLLNTIDNVDEEQDDIYRIERNIREYNANYDKIEDRYSKLKEDIEDQPDKEKPLINKLKSIEYDMNKCKKKITEKENKLDKLKRASKYYDGELEGAEKMKAEREILLENQKNVDNQGLIIDSIQKNVKAVGNNLTNINKELKNQDEKMDRIQEKVIETEDEIKKTSKIMSKMERRRACMKALTLIAIIVFGLFDITLLVYFLIKKFI